MALFHLNERLGGPWLCPVAGRALTSAGRGSADRSPALKGVAPFESLLSKKKKNADYHFWWSGFQQTAVINDNGSGADNDSNASFLLEILPRLSALWGGGGASETKEFVSAQIASLLLLLTSRKTRPGFFFTVEPWVRLEGGKKVYNATRHDLQLQNMSTRIWSGFKFVPNAQQRSVNF